MRKFQLIKFHCIVFFANKMNAHNSCAKLNQSPIRIYFYAQICTNHKSEFIIYFMRKFAPIKFKKNRICACAFASTCAYCNYIFKVIIIHLILLFHGEIREIHVVLDAFTKKREIFRSIKNFPSFYREAKTKRRIFLRKKNVPNPNR